MIDKAIAGPNVTEHELSEIKALIEKRSGILFDSSRERFFSLRMREHMDAKKVAHGTDLIRLITEESSRELIILTNATLFRGPRGAALDTFSRDLVKFQVSVDGARPERLRPWSMILSVSAIQVAVSSSLM